MIWYDGWIATILNYWFRVWTLFVSGFIFSASNENQLRTVCAEGSTITQFPLLEIRKQYIVLVCIHTRNSISEYLGIDLKIVPRIRKEFDESNFDYKDTEVWKPHSSRPVNKRIIEFVREIVGDNNPSKSISFIDWEMGVSDFLFRQVVYKNIRYFL